MSVVALVAVVGGMFLGGVSSGSVGFGIVLVSAPIVAFGAPQLLPAVFVAPALAANLFVAHRERRHRDGRLLGRLLAWTVPGMLVGLALLARITDVDQLALVVAITILVLVLAGVSPWRPARTRASEAVAASVAGLAGALSGTNGPPLAVLLAHEEPGLLRATLPPFFVVAQLMLLAGWTLVGRATPQALGAGLAAVPAALAGAWFGQRVAHRHLTPRAVRLAVLALALVAAARAVGSA